MRAREPRARSARERGVVAAPFRSPRVRRLSPVRRRGPASRAPGSRRDLLSLAHERAAPTSDPLPIAGARQHDRAHADQAVVLDHAAVDDRAVAHRDARARCAGSPRPRARRYCPGRCVPSPTSIGAVSPRTTVLNQTLERAPSEPRRPRPRRARRTRWDRGRARLPVVGPRLTRAAFADEGIVSGAPARSWSPGRDR